MGAFRDIVYTNQDRSYVEARGGQWRINHDANDAMAWGPPLKGAPRAESASDS